MAGRLLTPRVCKLAALAAVTAAAAGLLAVQAARLTQPPAAGATVPAAPDPAADQPAGPPDPLSFLLGGEGEIDRMLTPEGADPLDAPPAGLPVHARARRLIGYQHTADGWTEQVALWTIDDADAADIAARYARHAERAGFTPRNPAAPKDPDPAEPPGAPDRHTRWFTRGGDALMIRTTAAGREVRLTLMFRYTEPPNERP